MPSYFSWPTSSFIFYYSKINGSTSSLFHYNKSVLKFLQHFMLISTYVLYLLYNITSHYKEIEFNMTCLGNDIKFITNLNPFQQHGSERCEKKTK